MTREYVRYKQDNETAKPGRPADTDPDLAKSPRAFAQPDAIHGAIWYPTASLSNPETYCFMASIRDTPVRLIDATDGRVCVPSLSVRGIN